MVIRFSESNIIALIDPPTKMQADSFAGVIRKALKYQLSKSPTLSNDDQVVILQTKIPHSKKEYDSRMAPVCACLVCRALLNFISFHHLSTQEGK